MSKLAHTGRLSSIGCPIRARISEPVVSPKTMKLRSIVFGLYTNVLFRFDKAQQTVI